jgi:hypothetical protein
MDGEPDIVNASAITADGGPTGRIRRALALASALLVMMVAGACTSEQARTAEQLVLERYPAASGAEAEGAAVQALASLAEVDPVPRWQVWRRDLGADVRRGAGEIVTAHLDLVMEAAGSQAGPPRPTRSDLQPDQVAGVLRHVLADEAAGERVARATGARMEAGLTPELAEPDEELQWAAAGWMGATDAVLDELGDEAERRWYRAATLASLEAAEDRARAEGGDAPWGMLAAAYARYLDDDEQRWNGLRWSSALAVYAVPLRWMQQDPAAVRELARTEAPEWGLDEGIVQRWRTGEDVSDDPEVLEFALAWAGGSTRSKAGG